MKNQQCLIKDSTGKIRLTLCQDLKSVTERWRPNVKGLIEVLNDDDHYVMAKQGDYRYKGIALNYCPFCGEAIRSKPADLPSTKL